MESKKFGLIKYDVYSTLKIVLDFFFATIGTALINYLAETVGNVELGSWQWLILGVCLFLAKLARKWATANNYQTINGSIKW